MARDPRYLTALASTGSEMIVPVIVGDRVVEFLRATCARLQLVDVGTRVGRLKRND